MPEEDIFDEYEDEYEDEERCSKCGRPTAFEVCGGCGRPLCPMCFETGGGLCGCGQVPDLGDEDDDEIERLRSRVEAYSDAVSEVLEWLEDDDWPAIMNGAGDREDALAELKGVWASHCEERESDSHRVIRAERERDAALARVAEMEAEIGKLKAEFEAEGYYH